MEPTTVVAVDIGGTKIACGLVTFTGEGVPVVESVERVPTNPLRGGKAVLADVIAAVEGAVARSPRPVAGVGISTGGVVDPRTGDITYANEMMPGWSGTPLGTAVEEACGLPCRVLNDVHAHALGEARWGGGRGYESVLVVAVGTGISGAIVDGGVLSLGAHDMDGNVGHMACEEAAGIECTCGAVGHLESVAAGPAIVGEYVRLSGADTDPEGNPVGGAYISRAAEEGDEAAVAAMLPALQVELRYDGAGQQKMFLNGRDVSGEIPVPEGTRCQGGDNKANEFGQYRYTWYIEAEERPVWPRAKAF